jgi:hypothetical protein
LSSANGKCGLITGELTLRYTQKKENKMKQFYLAVFIVVFCSCMNKKEPIPNQGNKQFQQNLSASETKGMVYQISNDWYMLTCAGYTYHLYFDTYSEKVILSLFEESSYSIHPCWQGTYSISNLNKKIIVNTNFKDFNVDFSFLLPFDELTDEIADTISKEKSKLICDPSLFSSLAKDTMAFPYLKNRNFISKPALFPMKITGLADTSLFYKDLNTHCFLDASFDQKEEKPKEKEQE